MFFISEKKILFFNYFTCITKVSDYTSYNIIIYYKYYIIYYKYTKISFLLN